MFSHLEGCFGQYSPSYDNLKEENMSEKPWHEKAVQISADSFKEIGICLKNEVSKLKQRMEWHQKQIKEYSQYSKKDKEQMEKIEKILIQLKRCK